RRPLPRWVITTLSIVVLLGVWEFFGRDVNPVFGSYPSQIALAFVELSLSGKLWAALLDSLQPFVAGSALAILVGVPLGLVIGRFRVAEASLGIYVTAGYAMPLIALVPLLVLWLGLGFKVKVATVFLMSIFPICINTWLGVTAVPKTLIEVGKSLVAPHSGLLPRPPPPATPPPHHLARHAALHHGRHPPRGRPRRGRHGDRRVPHQHLRARRHHHQLGQQFRHRHHVRADRRADGAGDRAQQPDRRG